MELCYNRTHTHARVYNIMKEILSAAADEKEEEMDMSTIVKVPQYLNTDYDFIAFSFDGKHSYEDFGIYRISDGSRYNENLTPALTNKIIDIPSGDGQYFFKSNHKNKTFNISFAFDKITEAKLIAIKRWLSGTKLGNLWFAEAPYKVYTVKVSGTPNIKYIPFEEYNDSGELERVYKGEGTVQFIAYYPYARTPDFIELQDGTKLPGNYHQSYKYFSNYQQIKSVLPNYTNDTFSYGDLPFTFIAKLDDISSNRNSTLKVDKNGIEYSADNDNGISKEE